MSSSFLPWIISVGHVTFLIASTLTNRSFTNHEATNSTHFNDIFSLSPTLVWAVGPQGIWHFDGITWTRQPHPAEHPVTLFGVWASSATDVWAVGEQTWTNSKNSWKKRSVVLHYDGAQWSLK